MVRFVTLMALPNVDVSGGAEDIHKRWFEVLYQERVQYHDNRAKKA